VAAWASWLVIFRKLRQMRFERSFVFELVLDYMAAGRFDVDVLHALILGDAWMCGCMDVQHLCSRYATSRAGLTRGSQPPFHYGCE
jgi:hypothetical protein